MPARGTRALPKVIGLFLLCVGVAQAGPFLPVQRLTLGTMNQDGDLFLRIKIDTVELSDGASFEVFLEHSTETGNYASTGSRFHLRPFETSVWEREAGEFLGETSGGGRMFTFAKEDAAQKTLPALRIDGFPSRFPKYVRLIPFPNENPPKEAVKGRARRPAEPRAGPTARRDASPYQKGDFHSPRI
jgi:hypothetical protein